MRLPHGKTRRTIILAVLFVFPSATGCYKLSNQQKDQQWKQAQQTQPSQAGQQAQKISPGQQPLPALTGQKVQQTQQPPSGQPTQQVPQGQATSPTPGAKTSLSGATASTSTVTIPAGATLQVALGQTLSSNRSHGGDGFRGSLVRAIVLDGKVAIPVHARILGNITQARASGRLETPALLSVTLSSIEVDGMSYEISTGSVTRQGESHKKRNEVAIGGGAVAGAAIGAFAGKGKGALIGSGAGAAVGTVGAAATGKQDIVLTAETILSFRLKQPLRINLKN